MKISRKKISRDVNANPCAVIRLIRISVVIKLTSFGIKKREKVILKE